MIDARAPRSTMNPALPAILKGKPRVLLLNKADLADKDITKRWVTRFGEEGTPALAINVLTDRPSSKIIEKTRHVLRDKDARRKEKGMKEAPIRAMVIGIPNVGKSQFINNMAGKNKTRTGARPGVTRHQTYIRAGKDFELLDNPGILWPKFTSEQTAMNLGLLGSIKDELLPLDDIALYGIDVMMRRYPALLKNHYGMDDVPESPFESLEAIAVKRGCLLKGGLIDHERAIRIFLHDFRAGAFGPLTLDDPDDV
jgi:ribosome biogenesis GTPase A